MGRKSRRMQFCEIESVSRRLGGLSRDAADQIRAIARLRRQRLDFWAIVTQGGALPESRFALGYYRPPLQGFQLAASTFAQKLRWTGRRQLEGRITGFIY